MPKKLTSDKSDRFVESVIREMTRLAFEHGAINLSQGYPDFPAPETLKQAASDAIFADINQYTITWGAKKFRDALASKTQRFLGIDVDPEREITVVCGSTEGMVASMLGLINPGDEVIIFEPFYENYGPDTIISGAKARYVELRRPDWSFDPAELAAAFNDHTKAIIINTPNNPTGKVFSIEELEQIAWHCQKWNALAITDEIYEHILYDGRKHVSMITVDGMRDRTVVVNSLSKSYSVTGWRVGWVIAAPHLCDSIRKMHDFLTVGAAAPLQDAGAVAVALPEVYYRKLAADYTVRRDRLIGILREAGFDVMVPEGAYYLMCGISNWDFPSDVDFCRYLIEKIGVAAVPGSSFFKHPESGRGLIRFTFCKSEETLARAQARLKGVQAPVPRR